MSIGKRFRLLNVVCAFLVTALAATIVSAGFNQSALNQAQQDRYDSYLLSSELRQSSDDLTRLARTYVVTGDGKYEAMYWDILAVRNGEKPRADGRKVALQDLMKALGFTTQEFDKLKEAERNSNSLVMTETIAMNAVKGLFDDGSGKFTKKGEPDLDFARRIMHDQKYHDDKLIIAKPIAEFETMLNARTQAAVSKYSTRGNILLGIIACMTLATAGIILSIIRSVGGVLRQISGQLNNSVKRTAELTGDFVATSKELSAVSTSQASAIQQTVATLHQISAMAKAARESAARSADVARRGQSTAEDGKVSMEKMLAAIGEIAASNASVVTEVQTSNTQMAEIVKIISQIGEKTQVINDIVFQTKLLSFNASVEAARAGEQGKGFAVVAEEVGKLAQLSGESAREISSMLSGSAVRVEGIIRETSDRVENIVNIARKKVDAGTQIAMTCRDSLTSVVNVVSEVNGFMDEITRAAREQETGTVQISEAMQALDQSTAQTANTAQNSADYVLELERNTAGLRALVSTIEQEILGVQAAASAPVEVVAAKEPMAQAARPTPALRRVS